MGLGPKVPFLWLILKGKDKKNAIFTPRPYAPIASLTRLPADVVFGLSIVERELCRGNINFWAQSYNEIGFVGLSL